MLSIDRIRSVLPLEPGRIDLPAKGRRAAVAAILTPELDLILMQRAVYEGDPWSGQLSFPGGRVEAGETVLEGAVREVREELGFQLLPSQLLGELDEVRTMGPLPPLVIRPFVFALDESPILDTNEEVARVHRLALQQLLANEGRGPMRHPWRDQELVLPRVDFDTVRLWGLTLHMVDDLLHRLDGRGRGLARVQGAPATPWDAERTE
ncbi:MAG: CoA pyrophosphatase [Myxococcota bacterium]